MQIRQIRENYRILDLWAVIHFMTGVGLQSIGANRFIAYSSIIGFEIIENLVLRQTHAELFQEQEKAINVISDLVVGIGGYELMVKLNSKPLRMPPKLG